ncbi:MAG: SDR family oxidoreductase [Acidimicrobiia bacterium]|nr:SDR family oxidoreductase [Acidimicrobiia bacterium]
MGSLDGLVALVTGGNGGIGLGMARALATAGADVAIWGRNPDKNATAEADLATSGVRTFSAVCDVADERQVADGFARTVAALGRVDVVFANAAHGGILKPITELTLDDWREVMASNLDGAFLTLREGARHLVERGGGGSLVAVGSTSSIHGAAGNDAYGASKTALGGLTRSMAVGLARHGIRVNCLVPGWTITDLSAGGYANDRFRQATVARTPVRRWADPDEMGAAAVFLADPAHTYHTGQSLVVDGGYTVY